VFEVVERLPHRRLHVAYAIRGQRGTELNHQLATTLGIWSARVEISSLLITSSVEAVDERDRVDPAEREAFIRGLSENGLAFEEHDRLDDAVHGVLERAAAGDLVLLLGAFGMSDGAEVMERWCATHGIACDTGG
jgi:UDP-N-acetylmuramoyl-L-alanyl-D-glutamate--2,6-diaminopimelate ligase